MLRTTNTTPFAFATATSRIAHPAWSLTLVVKGTFDLHPEERARPAEQQEPPAGDAVDPFGGEVSHRYGSDFAPFKPKADLLLCGSAHAPRGQPAERCDVTFRVGRTARTLAVFGDRTWIAGAGGPAQPSAPAPFLRMPLTYENAFGGPGSPDNPIGKGFHAGRGEHQGPYLLPNVEDPGALIHGVTDHPPPAGFGPLARTWASRASKLGTYDDRWLRSRWPWFPEDFDEGYFNAAPPPLQVDTLRGDEEMVFKNLHPAHAGYRAWLPALRVRCFLVEAQGDAERFREVAMNLDTLWVDMDAEKLVLVWRGITRIQSAKHEEITDIYVASEPLGEAPLPAERHRERLALERAKAQPAPEAELLPEDPPANDNAPDKEVDPELLQMMEQAREILRRSGAPESLLSAVALENDPDAFLAKVIAELKVDPDAVERAKKEQFAAFRKALTDQGEDPSVLAALEDEDDKAQGGGDPGEERLTREDVAARHADGRGLEGEDLSGLDLSKMDLTGCKLRGALLVDANLAGCRLTSADLSQATLSRADLSGATLFDAKLEQADLTEAKLEGADLNGARLGNAVIRNALLKGARHSGASAQGALFVGSDLTRARLAGADLSRANLAECTLDEASFAAAKLTDAVLERARGAELDLAGADLTRLRASEGARFPGVRARKAVGPGSMWREADLSGADLSLSALERADLSGANLEGANLHGANLAGASLAGASAKAAILTRANLFRGDLSGADLTGADLRGASLYEAEFLGSKRGGILLEGALLAGTKLAEGAPELPPDV